MIRALLALALVACGDERSGTTDAASEVSDVAVEATVATETAVAPDVTNIADIGDIADIADVTNPPDVAEVTPDAAEVTDVGEVTDVLPSVAACPVPSYQAQYPPPFPPFPYGEWARADACQAQPHDVVIVLGCPSEGDGSASDCQSKRAEMADELYDAGYAEHFITTGGAVHNQWNESDALATLLVGRGIPAAAIIKEPLAQHTDENIYYSTRIMEANGWTSAIVVSEDPGHLMFTGLCDASCCVALGRMTLLSFPVTGATVVKAGHYALSASTTAAECTHLAAILLCSNQDERKACKDDFQLDAP